MHKNAFGGRALPGLVGGAYSAPPDSLAGLRGKGMGVRRGREGKEEGRGGEEGKGRTPNI